MSNSLTIPGINILVHQSHTGDALHSKRELAGAANKHRQLEGFCLEMTNMPKGLELEYMTHIAVLGDTPWMPSGSFAGTRGQGLALHGIAIRLKGQEAKNYQIKYKVNMGTFGDTEWTSSGVYAGTREEDRPIEGIKIDIKRRKLESHRPTQAHRDFFEGIKKFNNWYDEGGPEKLGISAKSTPDLNRRVRNYRGKIAGISGAMSNINNVWRKLPMAKNEASVRILIRQITKRCSGMIGKTDDLLMDIKGIENETVSTLLALQFKKANQLIAAGKVEEKLKKSSKELFSIITQFARKKSRSSKEVESKNSSASAATAVKKKTKRSPIQKSNVSISSLLEEIKMEKQRDQKELKIIRKSIAELRAFEKYFVLIFKMKTITTDFKTFLENTLTELEDAKHQEDGSANHQLIWEHYLDRVQHDLRDLMQWQEVFKLSQ